MKDSMAVLAEKMRVQEPVLNDEGKFSLSRLAELIVSKYKLVRHKGITWRQERYNLIPVESEEIGILALTELYSMGLQDMWGARALQNLEAFLPMLSQNKIKEPPENWLFCKNAVLDLTTLKEIHPGPEYAVINSLPIDYNPKAECPVLLAGFKKAFSPELQEAFLSIFGARLTGSTKLKSHVIIHGDGNQSKGTWREVMAHIFGKRMSQDSIEYAKDRFRSKSFIGSCIIWNSETDNKHDTARLIKEITGGTTLNLETKGKDRYSQSEYQAIFVEDTNNPPTQAPGAATKTRMEWLKLSGHFVREAEYELHKNEPNYYLIDAEFNENYLNPSELSGFLNLMLPYAQYYIKHQDYKVHGCKDQDALSKAADSIQTFIGEFITCDSRGKLHDTNVYKAYTEYCAKLCTEAKPSYMFYKELKAIGGKKGAKQHYIDNLIFNKTAYNYFKAYGSMPPEDQVEEA